MAPISRSWLPIPGSDTNTPCLNIIPSEHAGKMARYMARWVNSRNEPGPWSETVSATVAG